MMMIIGLCGEASHLKKDLLNYLSEKSFYVCSAREPGQLEHDKNYVIDIESATDLELWRASNVTLFWVGKNGQAPANAGRVVSPDSSLEEAQQALNEFILGEMRRLERPDWDEYFMKIAQVASMRSNCIKRKVGAVIVRDRRIISTGYNGTPRGTKNCNEGGCPRCNSFASSGTRLDECLCSHAEENAITQAAFHGTSVKEGTIYTTFAPCLMCSKMIINCGIIEVVFNVDYPLNDTSFNLFAQARVKIRQHRLV